MGLPDFKVQPSSLVCQRSVAGRDSRKDCELLPTSGTVPHRDQLVASYLRVGRLCERWADRPIMT
jgi:hypothetical protein